MPHENPVGDKVPLLASQTRQLDTEKPSYTFNNYGIRNPETAIFTPMRWHRRRERLNRPSAVVLLLAYTLIIALLYCPPNLDTAYAVLRSIITLPKDSDDYDAGASFAPLNAQKLWAAYSPYYSVEKYKHAPKDCRITQVNILQRHGARYPTFGLSIQIAQALLRLQAAESHADPKLKFLANYTYDLGTDDLLPFGEAQSFSSGHKAFKRYSNLANKHNLPFIRASDSDRVIKTAFHWADGFEIGSHGMLSPSLSVILPERRGFNNTLDGGSCPNAAGHPTAKVQEWQRLYAQPIADRWNAGARGLPEPIAPEDVQSLIALCALETVAKERYSPFCKIFDDENFAGYEYAIDVDKFYYTGYGSRLGPIQGVGYINELVARLTNQPVQDYTQTNTTLDSNPDTFPLGRGIYADFSHDNLMVSVISAMGLFNSSNNTSGFSPYGGDLDPTKPDKHRVWVLSRMVPFSARLVVERMECGLPLPPLRISGRQGTSSTTTIKDRQRRRREEGEERSVYVRLLMNDAVQMPVFCEGMDEDGLCVLEDFVKSQEYAREGGKSDWTTCFE